MSAPVFASASRKTSALAAEVRNAKPSIRVGVATLPSTYQAWSASSPSEGSAT
jgi:hypothetical protein